MVPASYFHGIAKLGSSKQNGTDFITFAEDMSYTLLLASWYPDQDFPLDGNFVARHAEIIHQQVCPAKVIHVRPGKKESYHESSDAFGMEIHQHEMRPRLSLIKWYRWMRTYISISKKIIAKNGLPSYIHVHISWPALIPGYILSKSYGIPLILTEHHSLWLDERFRKEGFLKKWILKKLVRKAQRITAVSNILAHSIENYSGQQVFIIPNLVQDIYFRTIEHHSTNSAPVFLHVSNFAEVKRPVDILKAFLEAKSTGMPGRMIMVGEPGPLKETCKQITAQSIYGHEVNILDQMDAVSMAQCMAESDILCAFSSYETQGITIAEAFALGKWVIQFDLPVLDIYPDGFPLIRVKNQNDLKAAMIQLSQTKSPERPEAIQEWIKQHFGRNTLAKAFQKIYQI